MTLEEAVNLAKVKNPKLIVVNEGGVLNPLASTIEDLIGREQAAKIRQGDVFVNDGEKWVHLADIRI